MKRFDFSVFCVALTFTSPALAQPCNSELMTTWKVLDNVEVNQKYNIARLTFTPDGIMRADSRDGQHYEGKITCKGEMEMLVTTDEGQFPAKYIVADGHLVFVEGEELMILRRAE